MGSRGEQITTASPESSRFDNATSFEGKSRTEQLAEVARLQNDMGQTGYEAGDPNAIPQRKLYVKTSKAFDINYYLNTGKVGSPNSNWTNLGYTERMIKNDIAKIDSGMKPMSEDIVAYRYVTMRSASRILGISEHELGKLQTALQNDPSVRDALRNTLTSVDYTQKAYSSLTYSKGHGTFDAYPIRFRTLVGRGTGAIVTNNHAEHEILVQRNQRYNFTGDARVVTEYSQARGGNVSYLEIDVIL